MMRNLLCSVCLVLSVLLLNVKDMYATHAMGADISYECLGNGQYRIVAAFYRDCSGIAEPTTLSAQIRGLACGFQQTVTLNKDANYSVIINGQPVSNGSEVSQICNAPGIVSRCTQNVAGNFPGVRVYFYTAVVTLPSNCGNVTIGFAECCRNTANNLANSQSFDLFAYASLNTDVPGCNDAPIFTTLPVPYYCVNQTYTYSHGALDTNGDSLVYTLVQPLDDLTTPVPYAGGFNPSNPFPNSLFTFDINTGTMNFRPTAVGNYVVAVRVDEYRNGVLIGNTIRDIQFVVINCNNAPPAVVGVLTNQNVTGAAVLSPSSIGVCPGAPVSFTITASDPDGQALQVTSNIAASIPLATITTSPINGRQDSITITFSWTPTGNDTGTRYLTLNVSDKACPIEGIQIATYEITVNKGVTVGPDRIYCVGGGPITINATGAQNFNWSPAVDFTFVNGPDSSTVIVVPTSSPRTYIVKGDLIGGCKDKDTIVITTVNTFGLSVSADDSSVCVNQSAELTALAIPGTEGPFTYSWNPSVNVDNPTSAVTRVRPKGTTKYLVEVRSKDGCLIRDSLRIDVQGFGPKVRITPSSNFVCPGTEVTLTSEIINIETGPSQNPSDPCPGCDFPFPPPQVGTGTATTVTDPTPYRCFWHDGRVQYLFRAQELIAAGMGPGVITDIQFFVASKASTIPYNNLTIKMGGTSLNQLPTAPNAFVTQNMFTVYTANYTTVNNAWNNHSLTTPFNWDGQSNIIVEVCFDNSSFILQWDLVRYSTAFPGATLFGGVDGSQGCIINPTGNSNLRPNVRFGFGRLPVANYNYTWQPSTGLSNPNTLNPTVIVNQDVVYNLFVTDSTCQGDTSVSLFVNPNVLTRTSPDVSICANDTATLFAEVITPQQQTCSPGYTFQSVPFDFKSAAVKDPVPYASAASGHNRNAVVNLPFGFKFFCSDFSSITVNENGLVIFGTFNGAGSTNTVIPSTLTPNNFIAGIWTDLNSNPNSSGSGTISTFVTGTFPYRCFIIEWDGVAVINSTTTVTFQIQLYETLNTVEVHYLPVASSRTKTLGLENSTGSVGFSPTGRNNVNFATTAPEGWRFTPGLQGSQLITFEWSPTNGLSSQFGDTVLANPAQAQQYVVKGFFTDGCITYDTINVSISGFQYALSASKLSLCPNESTQLNFSSPTAVSVAWSPTTGLSAPNSFVTNASPTATTTYNVVAKDAAGCEVVDNITITVKTNGAAKLGNDTAICYNASYTISPDGGPYTSYQWVPGGATTPTLTVSQSGEYFVVLSDGQCTFTSDTVSIEVYPQVRLSGKDAGVCQGDELTLNADAGYTNYLWNTGAQTSSITVNTAGEYSYSATDQFGCLQFSDTINFSVNAQPSIQVSASQNPFCPDSTASLSAGISQNGVVYSWALNSLNNVVGTGNPLGATQGGKYYVIADNSGCKNVDSITVEQFITTATDLGDDLNLCSCDTTIVLQPSFQPQEATYLWSTGATTSSISVSATGLYSLSITDQTGCPSAGQVFVQINCLTVEATTDGRNYATINDTVFLTAQNESYEALFEYIWQPNRLLNDSSIRSPKAISAETESVVYTLIVRDLENGCVAFDTVLISFLAPGGYAIPTAFSPNGDGKNDRFFPELRSPEFTKVNKLVIYNRWGQILFSCSNCVPSSDAGWDGSYNGQAQPAGTYLYAVEIELPDEQKPQLINKVNQSGSITLIK